MLGSARLVANLGSGDIDRTVEFYEGKLGLPLIERRELMPGRPEALFDANGAVICFEGGGPPKPGPNPLIVWEVDDIERTIAGLRDRGVEFEDYDLPGLKTEGGIASIAGLKASWFKDPDGNVLGLLENVRVATAS
jgi:catechol 2,3-dioxygenase-like lactoylglutathione lyase family enzyme